MRLIIARARTVLSPELLSVVQPFIIFSTPVPTSNATPVTSSTPKMNRVRSVVSVSVMTTFTRSLDFLDSQSTFHLIFSYNPTMFRLSRRGNNCYTTEDTEHLSTKLLVFCYFCQLYIFCEVAHLQYVGMAFYDSNKMLADIFLALFSFMMISQLRRRTVSLTPDDLFSRFVRFLSLFSPNTLI